MVPEQSHRRIAIIGLGLIGGSLGLALKAANLEGVEIIGYDGDRGVAGKARKLGAIDRAEHDLPRAVREAGLVIIATPILAIGEVMREIAPHLPDSSVVTDTGSTKAAVVQRARELLPPTVSFVGGHPLAGKETQGIDHAEATLFRDKAYCVCPAVDASESAVRVVLGLTHLIGAQPLFIDPAEHDQYVAAVSHLPLVLSTALFTLVRGSPGWDDIAPLAASGFRDLTRLASGDPEMSHDICLTNREAVLHWLDRLQAEIGRYRDLIAADGGQLFEIFVRAQLERDAFVAAGSPPRAAPQREAPEVREAFLSFFVGRAVLERVRRLGDLSKSVGERTAKEIAQKVAQPAPEGEPAQEGRADRLRRLFRQRLEADLRRELEKRDDSPSHDK